MHRLASILTLAATLGGCASTVEQPYQRTARQENDLGRALAGKVAGRPVDCLQSFRSGDMQVIDDNTILFRDGSRTYVQSPIGGCAPLGSGHYTLVTRSFGGSGLCRGDIARVVDLTGGGMTVGSCSLNSFVPFERPRHG
ncbi:MAG: hypothetical protein NVS3B5_12840 [Sphingomicrobium sp.]